MVLGWRAWRTQPALKWLRLVRCATQCQRGPERSRRAQVQALNLILAGSTNCRFSYFITACQRVLQLPRARSGESHLTAAVNAGETQRRRGAASSMVGHHPNRAGGGLIWPSSCCCFPQHFPPAPSHQRFKDTNCPSCASETCQQVRRPQVTQHSPQKLSRWLSLSNSVDEVRRTEPQHAQP